MKKLLAGLVLLVSAQLFAKDAPIIEIATKQTLAELQNLVNQQPTKEAKKSLVNTTTDKGKTALMKAAKRGEVGMVQYLISQGADAALVNDEKETAVHYALVGKKPAKVSKLDAIKMLVAAGNPITDSGLFYIVIKKNPQDAYELVRYLVEEQNLDVFKNNQNPEQTVLEHQNKLGRETTTKILQLLARKRADWQTKQATGNGHARNRSQAIGQGNAPEAADKKTVEDSLLELGLE